MSSSSWKGTMACAALAVALLMATTAQASLIGFFEQVSPTPTVYVQGTFAQTGAPEDPIPAGIDFTPFQDFLGGPSNTAFGDVTGTLQYVPGLGDDPQDFIDAGFVAGNIAMIDRGVVNFTAKINNAANAGAIGVLIANTSPSAGGLFEGGMPELTTIPALFTTYELAQEFVTGIGGGTDYTVHLSVTEPAREHNYPLGPGIWNTRIIATDDQNGATDFNVDDTMEALAILEFAGGGPNTNGWNIRYVAEDNRNLIDMAGGGGNFPSNHPYPNGEAVPDNSPVAGDDFVVTAETSTPILIPEGDWTIAFGSDDGGALRMPGVVFTAEINTDGDPGLDDSILFNAPRGHSWTAGEFTAPAGGLTTTIEAIMYDAGGGDSFEIAIAPGHLGNAVSNDDVWHTLQDGTYGWTAVPEPSTVVLVLSGLIGLLLVGLRRRRAA